jgi:hypothetical protein
MALSKSWPFYFAMDLESPWHFFVCHGAGAAMAGFLVAMVNLLFHLH